MKVSAFQVVGKKKKRSAVAETKDSKLKAYVEASKKMRGVGGAIGHNE